MSCGCIDQLIRKCVFDGKGSSKADSRVWRDPHVIYELGNDGKVTCVQTKNALGASDGAATKWAGLFATIGQTRYASEPKDLWIVGFSTVKNDKYLESAEWFLTVNSLTEQIENSIEAMKWWQKESSSFADNVIKLLRMTENKSSRKHPEITSAIAGIQQDIQSRVSVNASAPLRNDGETWQQAAAEYGPLMAAVAKSVSPGVTISAVQRRKRIANIRPDMQPSESAKKPSTPRKNRKKKGGNK